VKRFHVTPRVELKSRTPYDPIMCRAQFLHLRDSLLLLLHRREQRWRLLLLHAAVTVVGLGRHGRQKAEVYVWRYGPRRWWRRRRQEGELTIDAKVTIIVSVGQPPALAARNITVAVARCARTAPSIGGIAALTVAGWGASSLGRQLRR
jgi:hypothetical protein